jgi:hypothetical protein
MLNRKLYRQLVNRLGGEEHVTIVNEGLEMEASYQQFTRRANGVKQSYEKLDPVVSGEEYRISCPFCGDTRKRLYINHRWGKPDRHTCNRNLWLAQCYNEQCLASGGGLKLWEWLKDCRSGSVDLSSIKTQKKRLPRGEAIVAPGPPWSLKDICKTNPNHPALKYLWDRLIDPRYVAETFGVGYIIESHYALCRNRLYAPIIMKNQLMGWQCRRVLDDDNMGPKWFTTPGIRKGEVLYNYDNAIRYSTKVIVEGPSDVWNFGAQAMGLLGKSVAPAQIRLIVEMVEKEDVVVLMLDPDLPPDHKEGQPHHIAKAFEALSAQPRLAGKVVPIYLPPGTDPGMMDRIYMRKLIQAEAARRKLKVSFARRKQE